MKSKLAVDNSKLVSKQIVDDSQDFLIQQEVPYQQESGPVLAIPANQRQPLMYADHDSLTTTDNEPVSDSNAVQLQERMSVVCREARQHSMAGKGKQKEYYDKKASPPPLQAGDYVWYHDKKGYMSSKLIKRWKGVFIIKQRNLTATSQCCDHPDLPTLRVHVNMLKLHIGLSVKGELTDISIDLSEADPPSPEQPRVDSPQPEPSAEKRSKESLAHISDDKEKNPRVSTFWGGSSQLPNRLIVAPEECMQEGVS